jgi:hypothetical protein
MQTSKYIYQIRIKGHVNINWSEWFEELTVEHISTGDTVISGELPDQTALHGVLMKIRDLGLTLVEVKCVNCDSNSL